MNHHTLRGWPVLALLCLLPRVSASPFSVTQDVTESNSGNSVGSAPISLSTNALFAPFDPTLGALESATISTYVTVTASTWESALFSPFDGALSLTVSLNNFAVTGASQLSGPVNTPLSATGPSVSIPLHGTTTFSPTFTHTFSSDVTDPALLAALGTGQGRVSTWLTAYSSTRFGGTTMTLTANSTVTYVYAVPDHGVSSAALLALGFAGLWTSRRKWR